MLLFPFFFVSCYGSSYKGELGLNGQNEAGGGAGGSSGSGEQPVVACTDTVTPALSTDFSSGNIVLPTNCVSQLIAPSLQRAENGNLYATLNLQLQENSAHSFVFNGQKQQPSSKQSFATYLLKLNTNKLIFSWLNSIYAFDFEIQNFDEPKLNLFGMSLENKKLSVNELNPTDIDPLKWTQTPLLLSPPEQELSDIPVQYRVFSHTEDSITGLVYSLKSEPSKFIVDMYNSNSWDALNSYSIPEPEGLGPLVVANESSFSNVFYSAQIDKTTPSKINVCQLSYNSASCGKISIQIKDLPNSALLNEKSIISLRFYKVTNQEEYYIYGTIPITNELKTTNGSIGFITKLTYNENSFSDGIALNIDSTNFIYDKTVDIFQQNIILTSLIKKNGNVVVLGNFNPTTSPNVLNLDQPTPLLGLQSTFVALYGAADFSAPPSPHFFFDFKDTSIFSSSLLFDSAESFYISGSVQASKATLATPIIFNDTKLLTTPNPYFFLLKKGDESPSKK